MESQGTARDRSKSPKRNFTKVAVELENYPLGQATPVLFKMSRLKPIDDRPVELQGP
jgi:hypothetical protein